MKLIAAPRATEIQVEVETWWLEGKGQDLFDSKAASVWAIAEFLANKEGLTFYESRATEPAQTNMT